jgi:hypothetical protein
MRYQEILNREMASLPDYLKRERLDFLYFLKKKGKRPRSVSEPSEEGGSKPAFGCGAVKINIAPDFDAPI